MKVLWSELYILQYMKKVFLFCCLFAVLALFCMLFSNYESNTFCCKVADYIENAESFFQNSSGAAGFDTVQDICEPVSKRTVSKRPQKTFQVYDADISDCKKYCFINKISVEYIFKNFYFISIYHKNCLFVRAGPEIDICFDS